MTVSSSAPTVDAASVVNRPAEWTIIDVRTPAEFETAHVEGSYNVPLDVLSADAGSIAARLDGASLALVCQSGARAQQAQRILAGTGRVGASVVEGGVPAFANTSASMVRGRASWALERQVRLVAGSIVLGSVLASLRAPKARFVAGGIGAGLTFSALSNTCAMGRVLMMLPYNKGPRARSASHYLDQLPS